MKVEVLEPEDCSNSELLLIKVRAEGQQGRAAVLQDGSKLRRPDSGHQRRFHDGGNDRPDPGNG